MASNIYRELYDYQQGNLTRARLFSVSKDNLSFIQRFQLGKKLKVHNGCVNTVCWNDSGQLLLSGSDDRHLIITDPYTEEIKYKVLSGHHANIFSAKFLPNTAEKHIVSCSGDGLITFTDLENSETRSGYNYNSFDCHFGTVYEVVTVPGDSNSFLSCGEDGTVRWFDLRVKDRCVKSDCTEDVLINCRRAVTSLAVNPLLPWQLSVGCSDGTVVMYDRRKLATKATGGSGSGRNIQGMVARFSAPSVEGRNLRITSLTYSDDAEEVLVSYSTDHVYLFNIKEDSKAKKLSSNPEDAGEEGEEGTRPPVKRLRLRGDWSDTGPNAVPERERGNSQIGNTAQNIMQRMSDMLTRWLEDAANQEPTDEQGNENEADSESQGQSGRSQGQNDSESENVNRSELEAVREMNFGEINVEAPATSQKQKSQNLDKETSVKSNLASHQSENETTYEKETNVAEDRLDKLAEPSTSCDSNHASEISKTVSEEKIEPKAKVESQKANITVASSDSLVDPKITGTAAETSHTSKTSELISSENAPDKMGEHVSDSVSNEVNTQNVSVNSKCDSSAASDLKTERAVESVTTQDLPSTHTLDSTGVTLSAPRASHAGARDESELKDLHRMVDKLKSQALEPTVSLSYSSQGASTSQIKFHFPPKPNVNNGTTANQNSVPDAVPSTSQGEGRATSVHEQLTCSSNTLEKSGTDSNPVDHNPIPISESKTEATAAENDEIGDDFEQLNSTGKSAGTDDSLEVNSKSNSDANNTAKPEDSQKPSTSTGISEASVENEAAPVVIGDETDSDTSVRPRGIVGRRVVASDSDSDSELGSPPVARTGAGGSSRSSAMRAIEQNLAARRLQRVFRRRQEQTAQQEEEEMDLPKPAVKRTYRGHRNARTMIKQANFWGRQYVLSGSDCGHVFMWDRQSARLVMLLEADAHVVNCVQPHPYDPILATSGIDYDIKLWGPFSSENCFDSERAEQIMERNKVMLEETKDTLTVPASFMLRMLASINRVRAARRGETESNSESDQED